MKQLSDAMQKRVRQSYENQAFLRHLGIQLDEIEYGQVTMHCGVREELTQQRGFIHGGVLSTIADVSCGYVALSTMGETSEVLTVEFKMNILRASSSSQIFAHAHQSGENPCGGGVYHH